jgi:hypothetical protein
VKFYEVMVDACSGPLAAEEIVQLFREGKIRRSDPCRELGQKQWRTIDEIFPLLKYDRSGVPASDGGRRKYSVLDAVD